MKLISWNINGYRAIIKKGFFEFINKEKPEILALQETKVCIEQLKPNDYNIKDYHFELNCAQKKGYSGVACFYKNIPLSTNKGMGIKEFDNEGRVLQLEYPNFYFMNIYFPNGGMSDERLKYKLDFYEYFLQYIEKLRKNKKPIIFCGDVNTAHNEIDLARPKENENNTGFLKVEREWLDRIEQLGWIDTFRYLYPNKIAYSWWDYKTKARERDVGWRIDYFFINKEFINILKDAYMLKDVYGSDHCPIAIDVEL